MVNDKEYELVQDDEIVAGASGANAFNEIQNYAAQYGQDGPVEIYEVTRRKIGAAAAPQVVADERELPEMTDDLIFEWAEGYVFTLKGMPHKMTFSRPRFVAAVRTIIAHLPAAAPVQAQEPKPFAGPGAWFSVDVLGNPMREYAPGKWENCAWPSVAIVEHVNSWGAQQREAGYHEGVAQLRNERDNLLKLAAEWQERAEKAEAESAHKQSIIDRLMLEYCPDEMTAEQMMEWASHQKRAE